MYSAHLRRKAKGVKPIPIMACTRTYLASSVSSSGVKKGGRPRRFGFAALLKNVRTRDRETLLSATRRATVQSSERYRGNSLSRLSRCRSDVRGFLLGGGQVGLRSPGGPAIGSDRGWVTTKT